MLRRTPLVCCLLALLAHAAARADSRPLQLRYSAPAGCPGDQAFLAQVAARAPDARLARAGEPATAIDVVVRDVAGGNAGTLELAAPGAPASRREVSAADCAQVVSALALMTALAIDPAAALAPARVAPPAAAARPAAVRAAAPAPSGGERPARWAVSAGSSLEALGGVAPDPLVLVRPYVQVALEPGSRFSYALRLSAARARAEATVPDGDGDFSLWAARLEPCPLRFSAVRALGLSACLALDAGRLQAAGSGLAPDRQVARPWLALGGTARVEWRMTRLLLLEAAGELFAPIVRDRFTVGSDATLHRTPAVAGGASAGLGVRFP